MGEYADIKDRIKELRLSNGWSQQELADKLGVTNVAVSQWERGVKQPKMEMREALCDLFNVNMEYLNGNWDKISRLLTEDEAKLLDARRHNKLANDNSRLQVSSPRTVKVYGRIAGGVPIEMIEDVIDEVDLTTVPVKPGQKYFGLKISGHSMEPDIKDGDYIICIQADDAESGSIVAATVNGNDATCKRIMKYQDGIRLLPINPSYEVQYYTNKEVEELPVRVIGVVVESRHRYM